MVMQWTPDLATGVKEIDEQHVELFRRIQNLLDAWDQGKAWAEVETTIQFLSDYVVEHFAAEEQYMQKFNYGSASAHKAQHELFITTFGRIKEQYMKEGTKPEVLNSAKALVVDWLKNHITYSDKALGLFLKLKM